MRKLLIMASLLLAKVSPAMAVTDMMGYDTASTDNTNITLGDAYWIAVHPRTASCTVLTYTSISGTSTFMDTVVIPAGQTMVINVNGMSHVLLVRATATVVDYAISTFKEATPQISAFDYTLQTAADSLVVIADSLVVIADSLQTLLSTVTDSYGMMPSTGRVTTVINESADDIAYGTPRYYAVPMAGYSRCTLKCIYGSTTTSIPLINVLLSETSDITLATGNPVWFDTSPADSTIGGWYMHGVPATTGNLGKTIQVTDIYGNWATADYLIVKVTATTNTANDVQDFKLIAIKEQ